MEFTKNQQVVIKRQVRISPAMYDMRVGTILALSEDNQTALVSIPSPGGKIERTRVSVSLLKPVTESFKRSSVQFNPAFRQVGRLMQ